MDEIQVAGDFGPDRGNSRSCALPIAVRCHSYHRVSAILSFACQGPSRISHAAPNVAVTKAHLISFPNSPMMLAISKLPNFGSHSLKPFIPEICFTFHRETPTRDVTKLSFIVLSFVWQTSRTDGGIVELDWLCNLHQGDVMDIRPPVVSRIENDFVDFMQNLVRIILFDVVIADCESVRSWISVFEHAMCRCQYPILTQNGCSATEGGC